MSEKNLTEEAIRDAIIRNNLTIEEAQDFFNELSRFNVLQKLALRHFQNIVTIVTDIQESSKKKSNMDLGDVITTIETETQIIVEWTDESLKHINNIWNKFPQDFSTSLGVDEMRSNSQDFINFFMQLSTSLVDFLNS